MSKNFDVVVIGGGPGGYIAAIRAAQLGFNVACVDEWKNEKGGPAPGGTCTNVGCIPSKALLQSSENFEHAGHAFADHGINVQGLSLDLQKMLGRKNNVVKQNNDGILFLFKKEQSDAVKKFATAWFGLAFLVSLGLMGYDRAVGGIAEYGTARVKLNEGLAARRMDAAVLDKQFGELDREIGQAAETLPGRKSGQSAYDELAAKARKLAEFFVSVIFAVVASTASQLL